MRRLRLLMMVLALALAAPMAAAAQNETPGAARDEYVPIDQLPPEAELPAAPMVIAAYSFVWAAFLVYTFSVVRRLQRVERDLKALEHKQRT